MGLFNKRKADPSIAKRSVIYVDDNGWRELVCSGEYTPLADTPEIRAAVDLIANVVSNTTIHLMENTEKGDIRVRDGLARKIDIEPCDGMTRKTFIANIVRTMLVEGDGNAYVLPRYRDGGLLDDLRPVDPALVTQTKTADGGQIVMIGGKDYAPDELLHFVLMPDPNNPWKGKGLKASLKDIAASLAQANNTKKAFLSSEWKPSLVVKVSGLTEDMKSQEGREKILDNYIKMGKEGKPWVVPAEAVDVKEVRPLSLTDLAIADCVSLDKQTVAAITGVPGYVLGVGQFSAAEWNNTINTTIRSICAVIEQELTRKLLTSANRYFRFNMRSLYSYDITQLSNVGREQYAAGIMTGNEVRDWLSMDPIEGLDELVMLENYIPRDKAGDQKKLN